MKLKTCVGVGMLVALGFVPKVHALECMVLVSGGAQKHERPYAFEHVTCESDGSHLKVKAWATGRYGTGSRHGSPEFLHFHLRRLNDSPYRLRSKLRSYPITVELYVRENNQFPWDWVSRELLRGGEVLTGYDPEVLALMTTSSIKTDLASYVVRGIELERFSSPLGQDWYPVEVAGVEILMPYYFH